MPIQAIQSFNLHNNPADQVLLSNSLHPRGKSDTGRLTRLPAVAQSWDRTRGNLAPGPGPHTTLLPGGCLLSGRKRVRRSIFTPFAEACYLLVNRAPWLGMPKLCTTCPRNLGTAAPGPQRSSLHSLQGKGTQALGWEGTGPRAHVQALVGRLSGARLSTATLFYTVRRDRAADSWSPGQEQEGP